VGRRTAKVGVTSIRDPDVPFKVRGTWYEKRTVFGEVRRMLE